MNRAANWIQHSSVVRLALSETLSKLEDAEAEQRGYLLSKDTSFLGSYNSAKKKLQVHLNQLRLLVTDNPEQVKNVDILKTLIDERIRLLQEVLDATKAKTVDDQYFRVHILRGKSAMQEVEDQLSLMNKLELDILRKRTATNKQYVIATPLYTAILTLLALLIIIYAFYKLRRELKISAGYLDQSRISEEKARKANFLLENAEQITGSGSWEWNYAQGKTEFSDNMYRLYGYEPNGLEPGSSDFMHLIDEDGRNEMLKSMEEDKNAGRVNNSSFWITRKDGQKRYFHCISRFDKNEKGEDIILGTTRDITEQYLLKQDSEQRARFTELVVDNNVDMIAAFDNQLRVTVWNKAYEDMFGVTKSDIMGKKLTDVFPYLENDVKTRYLRAALQGKETIRQEFNFFRNQRIGEISIIPLKDDAGNITGVLTTIHDMTEIKKSEILLKESHDRFEYAEKAGNMGSFHWNMDTGKVSVSENLYLMFGYEPQVEAPSVADFFKDIIHPGDMAAVVESHKKNIENGTSKTIFCRIIRKDGQVRQVKGTAMHVLNEKGENVLFANILDITEENLLKKQLEERNELVESLIETSADMIEVIDTQMRYTIWNKANERQFGLKKEEVLGRNIMDVFPMLKDDKRMVFIENGLKGRATYRTEQTCLNSTRMADFSYIPLHNADGSITGLLIMAHDITERIKAEEKLKRANTELYYRNQALQETYAFNRHITDLAPNAIYVLDLVKGKHVFGNKRVTQVLGLNQRELDQADMSIMKQIIHPDDLPGVMENFRRLKEAKDGEVFEIEYRILNKEGEYRHQYGWETAFKRDAEGKVEQIIGVALDVTDLKKAENELREKNKALQQSNEELASFNYIASHDLQEPLRKIQTFSNFLEETEKGLSDQGRSSLQRMQMAAGRMRNLINDLLAFSRIDMVKQDLESVDLNDVLKVAKSSLRTSLDEKGAVIDACELPVIQGVPFQMQQLFENIIGNAVKYSVPGITPVVTIRIEEATAAYAKTLGLRTDCTYHKISFQDNGIGFEQQYADKIFELFQRLHTKHEYPGTGLGLAICKKIVQNHGGHIQATSKIDEGSVFEIYLPVVRVMETV